MNTHIIEISFWIVAQTVLLRYAQNGNNSIVPTKTFRRTFQRFLYAFVVTIAVVTVFRALAIALFTMKQNSRKNKTKISFPV